MNYIVDRITTFRVELGGSIMDTAEIVETKLMELLKITSKIDKDVNLFELGLESLMIVHLILELEEEIGIEFDDEKLLLENFESIEKIVMVIENNKEFQ